VLGADRTRAPGPGCRDSQRLDVGARARGRQRLRL